MDIANFVCQDGAPAHNNIYRGKYLGGKITDAQYEEIENGTFRDMFIGDYWIIKGKYTINNQEEHYELICRIAAFDYYYLTGEGTYNDLLKKHHITIVTDNSFGNAAMYINDYKKYFKDSGYANSEIRTKQLQSAYLAINGKNNVNILTHKRLFSKSITKDGVFDYGWFDSNVELMNEVQIYGTVICGRGRVNSTVDNRQFPLFSIDFSKINIGVTYLLSSIHSEDFCCCVRSEGFADIYNVDQKAEMRITFSIF